MTEEITGYFAPENFIEPLKEELGETAGTFGRLIMAKGTPKAAFWAQNIWYDPIRIKISSIGDAAKKLRDIQRNWICYSFETHRRTSLIQEKLPHVSAKPISFPSALPSAPLGCWCLIDKETILASARTSSHFPNGEVHFIENKTEPPNRAYLKLWEAFTIIGKLPDKSNICVDLGSSPGGWTWVLAKTGAKVISIDKAPLDNKIVGMKNVEFIKESAFAIDPKKMAKADWMCCDIACYPERLYRLINNWIDSGNCRNFICTIKFQGPTDHNIANRFAEIPGARIVHLYHNKHELTFIRSEG